MRAIKNKMVIDKSMDIADYPTDQLTFHEIGGNEILSKNLFEINQMIKKNIIRILK